MCWKTKGVISYEQALKRLFDPKYEVSADSIQERQREIAKYVLEFYHSKTIMWATVLMALSTVVIALVGVYQAVCK